MRERLLALPGVGRIAAAIRASYRRKLAVALFVVLLICGVAVAGLYVQVGGLLDENVEQSMTASASAEAGELTEWSNQHRLVARALSEHPVYEGGNDTAIRAHLRSKRADWTDAAITDAYLIDRRNRSVGPSTARSLDGTPVSELPWEQTFAFQRFDDVRTTQPYRTADGETVVGFVTPIRLLPEHLLVVAVDTTSVFGRFEHPVDGGFTRVVNSNGTVVFADDRSATLEQYLPGMLRAQAVSSGLHGESGFVERPRYGQSSGEGEYVAAYAPVAGTDWVVVEHAPRSEAYAINRQARAWIGALGFLALLGCGGVVLVLGADVTRALSRLSRRADRIQNGEYDVEFDTDRPDEFGDLNRTLATTRDTLRQRIDEVRETRDALEASNAALEKRSAMVSVLNRILRHNVRNDVNVIAGRAELAAKHADDDDSRREFEIIRQTARDLGAVSDRTQRIKQLLSAEATDSVPIELPDRLDGPLREVQETYPESTVSIESADGVTPIVDAVEPLPLAIADVIEQIISHNDGGVDIAISVQSCTDNADAGFVVVSIDDDGNGLPEVDVQAVSTGTETPLDHAEGLALWCLEWTVNESGGDLCVDAADATVEIRLPAYDAEPAAAED
ncbi:Signal transduction histidine kinase [Natronoarchaeum philippinense]|uniref:histidine kinase n=1 Tax=Natronoarchaeum philippinense TaxID=558529 RepID=A0A285P884_NATPI|nr:HAMP domain-containing protein [Natronoarchaeum philippinense]SNZ17922.1 Signal transduction histidine kinase [Natronoarchaeum philippinense]